MAEQNDGCVECLKVNGGNFFDDTLGVVPVEDADWWEAQ